MPNPQNLPAINLLYQGTTTGWTVAQPQGGPGPVPAAVTVTATTTTDVFEVQSYNSATAFLGVSTGSGTLQTYVQTMMPDLSTWVDYAAFYSTTTTTAQVAGLVSAGNSVSNASLELNSLTGGTVRTIPLGTKWRWVFRVSGASPTFTLTAAIAFYG